MLCSAQHTSLSAHIQGHFTPYQTMIMLFLSCLGAPDICRRAQVSRHGTQNIYIRLAIMMYYTGTLYPRRIHGCGLCSRE